MNRNTRYLLAVVVFVAAIALASVPLLGAVAKVMVGVPVVGIMIPALFQLSRDQAGFERAVALQLAQHSFTLGATSHMAAVAFDKYVEFSEKYVAETSETLTTLFQKGPTEHALTHAGNLYRLRQQSALWLTPAIDAALEKFEAALRTIGANTHFVETALDHPSRSAKIDELFITFAEVMGMPTWEEKPVQRDLASRAVIQKLRQILGTEELTRLRDVLLQSALHRALE